MGSFPRNTELSRCRTVNEREVAGNGVLKPWPGIARKIVAGEGRTAKQRCAAAV